jgi:hypothetical protein
MFIALGHELTYFVQAGNERQKVLHIKCMLEFFIDSIFVELGGHIFNKSTASLWEIFSLFNLFLYSYEAEFIQKLIKDTKIQKLQPLVSLSGI